LFIADGNGRAEGIFFERDLRLEDVLGKVIVVKEVGTLRNDEILSGENCIAKRGCALGVIGCQCIENYP
jgi:hypothetical protein